MNWGNIVLGEKGIPMGRGQGQGRSSMRGTIVVGMGRGPGSGERRGADPGVNVGGGGAIGTH